MKIIAVSPTLFSGKVCVVCGVWKPLEEFLSRTTEIEPYDKRCSKCRYALANVGTDPSYRKMVADYEAEQDHQRRANQKAHKHEWTYRRRQPVTITGSFTGREWRELCAKYDNRCLRCNKRVKLTPDHVVPLSKGGWNTIDNIQPLCFPCNIWKKAKTIDYRPGYKRGL